jgi:hypothetical protein
MPITTTTEKERRRRKREEVHREAQRIQLRHLLALPQHPHHQLLSYFSSD